MAACRSMHLSNSKAVCHRLCTVTHTPLAGVRVIICRQACCQHPAAQHQALEHPLRTCLRARGIWPGPSLKLNLRKMCTRAMIPCAHQAGSDACSYRHSTAAGSCQAHLLHDKLVAHALPGAVAYTHAASHTAEPHFTSQTERTPVAEPVRARSCAGCYASVSCMHPAAESEQREAAPKAAQASLGRLSFSGVPSIHRSGINSSCKLSHVSSRRPESQSWLGKAVDE